ncbi:MAG: hypothetical protein GAK43_02200 [Stenotrophomonas maltophilia]|nr:MAG: hypothetical protein GAK43_02200 [Stenotrophomonas maltophilia]
MCLIVFAWQPGQALPLIVAANRDEFYARPTRPLGAWEDAPGLFAGRDLEAGGTWLGIGAEGRFAALTNVRDPGQPLGPRSRGELVADYLRGQHSPATYLDALATRAAEYSGFNLLLGNPRELYFFNSCEGLARAVEPGLHGLSNASLDTPWPKLVRTRDGLGRHLAGDDDSLLRLLADDWRPEDAALPETGVGMATERLLGAAFIASPNYGTRASSVLRLRADAHWSLVERSFGPLGAQLGEVRLEG